MIDNDKPVWLRNYEQYLDIKNTILIHGNIYDYSVVGTKENSKYKMNVEYIESILISKRNSVVVYDKLNGIKFINISDSDKNTLLGFANANKKERMGDDTSQSYTRNSNLARTEKVNVSVVNFLNMIHESTKVDMEVSFLITMGDSIFGKLGTDEILNEEQNMYLYNLVESTINLRNDNKNRNIVIVCEKDRSFPSTFHINNIRLRKLFIPKPNKIQREKFYDLNKLEFNIRADKIKDFIDDLDEVSLVEMEQIGKLTKKRENLDKDYEQVLSQFRYGTIDNPWNQLRKSDIQNIETILSRRVIGQNEAIKKVKNIVIKAYTGISGLQHSSKKIKPKGTLFLVGPTGVGKTELAKSVAEFLFGDESACIRFDMSEFSTEHSDQRLIGAPPGYVGHQEGGQLTNAVKDRPYSVLLFDEIEKAHGRILDKFLQILEDGRLTDGKGETVYFSNCIIIFTSNIGTDKITINDENAKTLFKEEVYSFFKEKLHRPELLNRIGNDNIIPFGFLKDDKVLKDIVISKLRNIDEYLKENYNAKIEYVNKDDIFLKLVESADRNNGGRGALNQMEDYLITPLSEYLFIAEESVRNSTITAEYDEDTERFRFE